MTSAMSSTVKLTLPTSTHFKGSHLRNAALQCNFVSSNAKIIVFGTFREFYMDDLSQMATAVRNFCNERDWGQFHTPKELAIGITTEAAELLELFRFQTIEQMNQLLTDERVRSKVADELADILFFLLRFSDLYGFDLEKSLENKIKSNSRRYPVETSRGNNRKAPHNG